MGFKATGTKFALYERDQLGPLRGLGLLMLAWSCMSCLITDTIDFTEPDLPPSLHAVRPSFPIARVSELKGLAGCDPDEATIEYEVSDPNIDQELEYGVEVNGLVLTGAGDLGPEGTLKRTPPALCINESSLQQACNVVLLMVSTEIEVANSSLQPANEDDMAQLVWFLLGSEAGDGALEECLSQGAMDESDTGVQIPLGLSDAVQAELDGPPGEDPDEGLAR